MSAARQWRQHLELAGLGRRGQRDQLRARRHLRHHQPGATCFRGNRFRDLRFAVHYMYTNNSDGQRQRLGRQPCRLRPDVFGAASPSSDNRSDGDRDHGLLLNYANGARIEGNAVVGGRREVRVHLQLQQEHRFAATGSRAARSASTSPPARSATRSSGNAFIGNRTQVKYVGTRYQEWSDAGRGNYWSDNPAFDLNGDGVADQPYRPNDLIDQVVWTLPAGQAAAQQPGGAGGALRAGPVPGPAAGRRRRQRAADGARPWCPLRWRGAGRMTGPAFALDGSASATAR